MSDDGQNWRESLPEQMREAPWIKDATSLESAIDQMNNANSRLGASITVPTGDASDEVMQQFYSKLQDKVPGLMRTPSMDSPDDYAAAMTKLGMPESADGYSVNGIEGAPEGEALGRLKAEALALQMTQRQFQEHVKRLMSSENAALESVKAQLQAGNDELRAELGAAYDKKLAAAAQYMRELGYPDEAVGMLTNGEMAAEQVRLHMAGAERAGVGDSQSQGGMQGKGGNSDNEVYDPVTARSIVMDEILPELLNQANPPSAARRALLMARRDKLTAMYAKKE